jgi:RHS repeat-associated protein
VWRWDQQEPFGVNVPDENPSGLGAFDLPLRLPGQYFDKETNLHYNYFRTYDSGIGRYLRGDPLGLIMTGRRTTATQLNHLYLYSVADPVRRSDPTGLDPGDKFPSESAAAEDAANYVRRIFSAQIWEFGGWIYLNSDCKTYSYTAPGTSNTSTQVDLGPQPSGVDVTADYHSHVPNIGTTTYIGLPGGGFADAPNQNGFSPTDINGYENEGNTGYLITPNQGVKTYVPRNKKPPQNCTC